MKSKPNILIFIIAFLILLLFIGKLNIIPHSLLGIKKVQSQEWSIGIYNLNNKDGKLILTPKPGVKSPILTAKDVTDRDAIFVADPFLVNEKGIYYLFFEVMGKKKGEIGVATSKDGLKWRYDKIVLSEPHHLSYPFVFKWKNTYYMIPESHQANSIKLYKSTSFPSGWELEKVLISGRDFVDSTLVYNNNKWWLFTSTTKNNNLYLYYAAGLDGPWVEHPKSPVVNGNSQNARCGGNIFDYNNMIIRFAQDDYKSYGSAVRGFKILELNIKDYKEEELIESPLIKASGSGWNKDGMHNISSCKVSDNEWIAAVDGQQIKEDYYMFARLPAWIVKMIQKH